MSAEQFEELMRVLRGGFLMLAMIGWANFFEPKGREFGRAGKVFLVVMQTLALAIAPLAMMKVLQ